MYALSAHGHLDNWLCEQPGEEVAWDWKQN